jgi:ABC-type multidrug transport system ATPase subunit
LLTVLEQLTLASILTGQTRASAAAKAEAITSLVGLEGCADAKAADLSSGQRKRLGIGIGLSRNADIYLFDEPGNGLDIQGAELLTTLLGTLRARGKIVLVATHPLPLVEEMSDLRWTIREGTATETAGPARTNQATEAASKEGSEGGGFLPWIRC